MRPTIKAKNSDPPTNLARHRRNSIVLLLLAAVVTFLGLSLWKVHSFPSHPWYGSIPEFAKQLTAAIAGAGTAMSVSLKASSFIRRALTKKRGKLKFKDFGHFLHTGFERVLAKRRIFRSSIVGLSCISFLLCF